MFPNLSWRKSSYSAGNDGNCVELAVVSGWAGAIRDSKNPAGPALSVDLAGFVDAVKRDRFGR